MKTNTTASQIFVSEDANQTTYIHDGAEYNIYDAFPTAEGAQDAAKNIRTKAGRIYRDTYTNAIVVDLGDDTDRLRYALFVSHGAEIDDVTTIDATDLQMHIDNERRLYDDIWTPVTTMLTRKKDAGTYDHDAAVMAFKHLIDVGARKYKSEYNIRISSAVKIETMESMRDRFEVEYDLGNYKYLVE